MATALYPAWLWGYCRSARMPLFFIRP